LQSSGLKAHVDWRSEDWKTQYQRLTKHKHPNQAIVAIARRLLVFAWHTLTKREPYRRADDETIAYKMMTESPLAGIWSPRRDEKALRGLTRQQFIKYGLLRLGVCRDLTRSERKGVPRRIAPPTQCSNYDPNSNRPTDNDRCSPTKSYPPPGTKPAWGLVSDSPPFKFNACTSFL